MGLSDVLEYGTRFVYRMKSDSEVKVIDFYGANHAERALEMLQTESLQDVQTEVIQEDGSKKWITISRGFADMHLFQSCDRLVEVRQQLVQQSDS